MCRDAPEITLCQLTGPRKDRGARRDRATFRADRNPGHYAPNCISVVHVPGSKREGRAHGPAPLLLPVPRRRGSRYAWSERANLLGLRALLALGRR